MSLIPITPKNRSIFEVFSQDYEAEFSALTQKEPDAEGRFALDASWEAPNQGFYFLSQEKPTGFAIWNQIADGRSDIAEFYILPCYRRQGFGKQFAFLLFDRFPGPWQVRQIPTAKQATAFWRSVIEEYTQGHYKEDLIPDAHWGTVLRQYFTSY